MTNLNYKRIIFEFKMSRRGAKTQRKNIILCVFATLQELQKINFGKRLLGIFMNRMNRRINLLIAFSVVALVALSVVQCYLVKTTYDYKVAQFHTEIKEDIARITNDFSDIDSAYVNKKE